MDKNTKVKREMDSDSALYLLHQTVMDNYSHLMEGWPETFKTTASKLFEQYKQDKEDTQVDDDIALRNFIMGLRQIIQDEKLITFSKAVPADQLYKEGV